MTRKLYVRENGLPALVDESEIATPLPAGAVRSDIAQSFDDSAKAQARSNISAQGVGETVTVSGASRNIIAARSTHTVTGNDIWFGMGDLGSKRGIFDEKLGMWMLYGSTDDYVHTELPFRVDGISGTTSLVVSEDVISNGWVYAGGFKSTSDRRMKKDFREIHPDLSGIKAYHYRFKSNNRPAYGLIAQEVREILPDAVTESGEDKHLTLDYNAVVAALVSEVNSLKTRIIKLEGESK